MQVAGNNTEENKGDSTHALTKTYLENLERKDSKINIMFEDSRRLVN